MALMVGLSRMASPLDGSEFRALMPLFGGDGGDGGMHVVPHGHRFLVYMAVGDKSLHEANRWHERDLRQFDLVLNYYGTNASRRGALARYAQHVSTYRGVNKFKALVQIVDGERPELFDRYDFVWMADDDLRIDVEEVNRMARRVMARRYPISQPVWVGHGTFDILKGNDDDDASAEDVKVPFVEVMMPCFRHDVLVEFILPFMRNHPSYKSSWGFDIWWSSRQYVPFDKYLLKGVRVEHTKGVNVTSGIYKALGMYPEEAFEEMERLKKKFNLTQTYDDANI